MEYFTGKHVGGKVRRAEATTFRDLVDRYINIAVPLNVTRAEYAAMDRRGKDAAKQVPYLTPARFSLSPCSRRTEFAVSCNLVFLDIDPAKDGSGSPATPLLANLDMVEDGLAPFSYCIYHTASSTPDLPRIRVMVSAKDIPLDRYDDAVRTVAKRLGLPAVTTESMVPVQPMFCPSLFADENPEEDHPMILSQVEGREMAIADLDDDVSSVATVAKRREGIARLADGSIDVLDFLRSPVAGVTLPMVADMLDSIDPDIEYRDWLEVAAAMRHQFTEQDEAAYQLFDTWSSKGAKYEGEEETLAKWQSFRPHTIDRVPVTIRSLMHRATLAGWNPGKVKQDQFDAVMAWITSCQSTNDLLAEAVTRIAATPLLSQAEEDALLHAACRQAKSLGLTISITSLRKDLRHAKDRMRSKEDKTTNTVPPWVRAVAYVANADEFFRQRTGEKYKRPVFDSVYGRKLLPTEKMLEEMGLPNTVTNMSRPYVLPCQYALNSVKVPTVWDYVYDPGSPGDLFVTKHSKVYVNVYRRTHPNPVAEEADEAGEAIMHHLNTVIAEEEYRLVLLDWLAFLVQQPGRKIRWAPLIQGAEGCGKSFFADLMAAVLGREHVKPVMGADIFSGYNDWAFGHQLVVMEEVRVSGHNRHEVMNVFKPLITNDMVAITEKFRNSRAVENTTNYMLLTNHKDSLVLNDESRRYFVLQSSIQRKAQVMALNSSGHFTRLYEVLSTLAGGLRHWLENHTIRPSFQPDGAAPTTTYLHQLVNDSAGEVVAAVRRILLEGDNPMVQPDVISSSVLLDMLNTGEQLKVSPHHLGSVLRDEGYTQVTRARLDDQRHYVWARADLGMTTNEAVETARRRLVMGAAPSMLSELI